MKEKESWEGLICILKDFRLKGDYFELAFRHESHLTEVGPRMNILRSCFLPFTRASNPCVQEPIEPENRQQIPLDSANPYESQDASPWPSFIKGVKNHERAEQHTRTALDAR